MVVDATVPLYLRGFRGHFQGNGVLCAENEGETRDDKCIAVSKKKFEGDDDEKSKVRRDVDGNKNICQHDNEEHRGTKLRSQRGENDREDIAGRERENGDDNEEEEEEEEIEVEPTRCQQGWRHISTLTRVMPVSQLSVL